MSKPRGDKAGLWKVNGEIKKIKVELRLVLTKQKEGMRAVPEISAKKKDILWKVCTGKTNKKEMLPKFQLEMDEDFRVNELLAALPAGGIKICK